MLSCRREGSDLRPPRRPPAAASVLEPDAFGVSLEGLVDGSGTLGSGLEPGLDGGLAGEGFGSAASGSTSLKNQHIIIYRAFHVYCPQGIFSTTGSLRPSTG